MSAVKYHYDRFPPDNLDYSSLIPFIGPANAAIARYDGVLSVIPNAKILLSPLTTQEAVLSSKIEGTQATMGEVLEFEAEGDKKDYSNEKRNDIQEILNYRKAINAAIEQLKTLPLCQRVILNIHKILMDSVRGQSKSPGEYRKIPNWIGPVGCTVETARYIPITADKLRAGMDQWENYIHTTPSDRLIHLAILHAEFEALHPFLDGNGRLGRMLIPLYLHENQLIQSPNFYISAYFEANREAYYEKLLAISRDNDWTAWCQFFLTALTIQAKENQSKATGILNLYSQKKFEITDLTRSQYGIRALDWIFERPIFKSTDFVDSVAIPKPTARRILKTLTEKNILKPLVQGKGRRATTYGFTELLNLAEGYNAF
jgi:Fic family protein